MTPRVVCWFSCGAASAVATKLAIARYPDREVVVARAAIAEEHPDNARFAADCSAWFARPITTLTNAEYIPRGGAEASIYEVFRRERYLVGPGGAHCTKKLKKAVREQFQRYGDLHVFGYTCEEQGRIDRFIDANAEVKAVFPLAEASLTKADCLTMVERAGIQLPEMYRLGYANNNCIGCVKGGAGYWNKIRVDFPEVYERMALMEEHLKRTVCKTTVDGKVTRVTLRQLPPDAGRFDADQPGECGIFCLMAEKTISGDAA